jgi:tetratricopeptide (TPR) repeat protein
MNYGLALMARGDYAGAIANFDKARAAWPNYSYIHINLGVAEQALGNPAKAEVHFRDALALDPRNPEAYAYYAPFLRTQGREHEAVEVARRGLSLSPGHLGLKAFLAAPAPAVAAGPPVLATPPADATAESLLDTSLALYRAGRYQESLQTAQRAAALRPDWDLAWNNVCAAYNSLGRWDDAIAAGEKAVRLNPAMPTRRATWTGPAGRKPCKHPLADRGLFRSPLSELPPIHLAEVGPWQGLHQHDLARTL